MGVKKKKLKKNKGGGKRVAGKQGKNRI